MDDPKISVIVPVYKVEPYLRKCLDSIVNQSCRNLEIILVDDGSPDNCGAICDEYASKDERIIVIHQENKGLSEARNAGLLVATGDYIGYVDSDDYIDSDMYEHLLHIAKKYDADISQCGVVFEEADKSWDEYCPPKAFHVETTENGMPQKAQKWLSCTVWNKLYKASTVKGIVYDWVHCYGEDLAYNMMALGKAKTVAFSSLAKYHYIQRTGSICHTLNVQKRYEALLSILNKGAIQQENNSQAHSNILRLKALAISDIGSQIARYGNSNKSLKTGIRAHARTIEKETRGFSALSSKERLKLLLISRAWFLYRPLILLRHNILFRKHSA